MMSYDQIRRRVFIKNHETKYILFVFHSLDPKKSYAQLFKLILHFISCFLFEKLSQKNNVEECLLFEGTKNISFVFPFRQRPNFILHFPLPPCHLVVQQQQQQQQPPEDSHPFPSPHLNNIMCTIVLVKCYSSKTIVLVCRSSFSAVFLYKRDLSKAFDIKKEKIDIC